MAQKEIENLNIPITIKRCESVILKDCIKKSPGQNVFPFKFYKYLKAVQIFHKTLLKHTRKTTF
jgi:hypothetical protein